MTKDWCAGCEIPERERVNLPSGWREGDTLPNDLTVHSSERDPRRFAFRGDPHRQDRVYLAGDRDGRTAQKQPVTALLPQTETAQQPERQAK